jgi:hypothetical protein
MASDEPGRQFAAVSDSSTVRAAGGFHRMETTNDTTVAELPLAEQTLPARIFLRARMH